MCPQTTREQKPGNEPWDQIWNIRVHSREGHTRGNGIILPMKTMQGNCRLIGNANANDVKRSMLDVGVGIAGTDILP